MIVTEGKILAWLEEVVVHIPGQKAVKAKKLKRAKKGKKKDEEMVAQELVITEEDLAWGAGKGWSEAYTRNLLAYDHFDPETDSHATPQDLDALVEADGDVTIRQHSIDGSYVSSIIGLYKLQATLGSNKHPNPRGAALQAWLKDRLTQEVTKKYEDYADRGVGGINSTYNIEEFVLMNKRLLEWGQRPRKEAVSWPVSKAS